MAAIHFQINRNRTQTQSISCPLSRICSLLFSLSILDIMASQFFNPEQNVALFTFSQCSWLNKRRQTFHCWCHAVLLEDWWGQGCASAGCTF